MSVVSKFRVPYINFSPKNSQIKAELLNAFERVIDGGRYIQGPEVKQFENEFAAFCGSKYAKGTANGTCSLELTLRAFDLPKNVLLGLGLGCSGNVAGFKLACKGGPH